MDRCVHSNMIPSRRQWAFRLVRISRTILKACEDLVLENKMGNRSLNAFAKVGEKLAVEFSGTGTMEHEDGTHFRILKPAKTAQSERRGDVSL